MPYLCQCRCSPHWGFYPTGPFSERSGIGLVCHSPSLAEQCQQCWLLSSPFLVNTFPYNDAQQTMIKRGFYEIAGFPNVIGAIYCTHVHLKPPSMNDYIFINRKNYHYINVQVICDARLSLLIVVTWWPGGHRTPSFFKRAA